MAGNLFPDVQKIAILRATALGDLIFALPALNALRAAYPSAELVYLGRRLHSSFLPGRLPGPHRVIAVPEARGEDIGRGCVIDPAQENRVFEELRGERFDLALQMHGAGEFSNPFVLSLAARHTAGLKSPGAAALERWIPYVYYQNEVARMLEVAALAGAAVETTGLLPRLPVLPGDLEAASPVLDSLAGRPFVVIHPGSTDPRRCWSPEKFAAVADYCAEQGLQVVLTGTSMEAGRINAVEAAARVPVLNLCDRLTLPGLVGLLSQAQLFVGNDSGPLHLALSAGTRSIGLFWVEYVVNSLPLVRETFYPLIAWNRTCPLCGKFCLKPQIDHPTAECHHEASFIEEISPEQAIQGVETLLSAGR